MAQFTGTLRIEGERGAPVPVRAEVTDSTLVLSTDGSDLGSWPLQSLAPEARGAGVGLTLDGDPVVIDVGNADRFFEAVARRAGGAKTGRKRRARRAAPVTAAAPKTAPAEPKVRRRPSWRVLTAVALGLVVVAGSWLAPTAVGSVALLLGLLLVIVASGAVVDSRIALRLPFGLEAMHIMIAGVGVVLIGVILVFLG